MFRVDETFALSALVRAAVVAAPDVLACFADTGVGVAVPGPLQVEGGELGVDGVFCGVGVDGWGEGDGVGGREWEVFVCYCLDACVTLWFFLVTPSEPKLECNYLDLHFQA